MQSNSEDMAAMLGHVTTVMDHMTNKRVQHLFLMKGSQRSVAPSKSHAIQNPNYCRYLQRLSEKLLYNLRLSNKAGQQCLDVAAKREQASASVDQLQPQYAHLVAITKQLQTQVRRSWGLSRTVIVKFSCWCRWQQKYLSVTRTGQ